MLGVSVAVCVRGQWSDPPPTCVRDGCRKLPIPLQGSLRQLYGGGVAVFSCNYGYEMEGQRILTCDGQKWNGSAPVCRGTHAPRERDHHCVNFHVISLLCFLEI